MSGRASRTKAWAGFVAAWMGISCGAVLFIEASEVRILVPVLAALTATASLWRPFPRAGLVTSLLAAGIFAGTRYLILGIDGLTQPAIATGGALLVLGLLTDVLTSRAEADALQRRHDSLLIEELTPTSSMGAMKWQHAQKELADEVGRARRYRYHVSLVLIGLDAVLENASDAAIDAAVRQRSELVRLLLQKLRTSDRVSFRGEDQLALMLPHTPLQGALTFLEKHLADLKMATGIDPRVGVAEFPTDAGTPEELVTEAEAALQFGRAAGVRIVSRSLLTGQETPATPAAPRTTVQP